MEQIKFKQRCPKHPQYKIIFLKINNILQSDDILYCSNCAHQDNTFKSSDYQLINEIIQSNDNTILTKWPPNNSQTTLDSLIQISNNQQQSTPQSQEIISKTINYFDDLKQTIINELNICQKQTIKIIDDHTQNNKNTNNNGITQKYQEISRINELKQHLLNNNTTLQEKNIILKTIIQQCHSQKDQNTQQLLQLLNQNQQIIFNIDQSNQLKNTILSCIRNIKLIQEPIHPYFLQKINIELKKTQLENGYVCQNITKNIQNQYSIEIIGGQNRQNTVSDIILDHDQKYIFRIKIDELEDEQTLMLGLVQDKNIHIDYASQDKMSSFLICRSNIIQKHEDNYGIYKQIKGDKFQLTDDRIVEIRVCLKDSILQLLDYPQYLYKIAQTDYYINNLKKQNLRLNIGLKQMYSKVTLLDAFTVFDFE